jgi:hypothetical protein
MSPRMPIDVGRPPEYIVGQTKWEIRLERALEHYRRASSAVVFMLRERAETRLAEQRTRATRRQACEGKHQDVELLFAHHALSIS